MLKAFYPTLAAAGALIVAAVLAFGFAGVRGQKMEHPPVEWFNDMAHQPKYDPQHRSEFFNDTRAARLPVPGTVPIGFNLPGRYFQTEGNNLVDGSGGFTNQPDYYNTGRIGEFYGDGIPEKVAAGGEELVRRGQQRYDITCAICHGKAGRGNGPVKAFGLMTVADLTNDTIKAQPDGQIFNTITHGKVTMGAYGPVVPVEDRWAIVTYVRALQAVAGSDVKSLPESEVKQLQEQK
jgi:mono/diheme cytochrome c family protein